MVYEYSDSVNIILIWFSFTFIELHLKIVYFKLYIYIIYIIVRPAAISSKK